MIITLLFVTLSQVTPDQLPRQGFEDCSQSLKFTFQACARLFNVEPAGEWLVQIQLQRTRNSVLQCRIILRRHQDKGIGPFGTVPWSIAGCAKTERAPSTTMVAKWYSVMSNTRYGTRTTDLAVELWGRLLEGNAGHIRFAIRVHRGQSVFNLLQCKTMKDYAGVDVATKRSCVIYFSKF